MEKLQGKTKWMAQPRMDHRDPCSQAIFLNLNIDLVQFSIRTSTYQKSLNLWLQNDPESCVSISTKFMKHLAEIGHLLQNLITLVKQAAATIKSTNKTKAKIIT